MLAMFWLIAWQSLACGTFDSPKEEADVDKYAIYFIIVQWPSTTTYQYTSSSYRILPEF